MRIALTKAFKERINAQQDIVLTYSEDHSGAFYELDNGDIAFHIIQNKGETDEDF